MAAYENLDNEMAKNLMSGTTGKYGKTLFHKPNPIRPHSEVYPSNMYQYNPPKPFTKTRPSVAQPSMLADRGLQDYMRAVYGVPGQQKPRIPGILGPASLLAALAPSIRDGIMGSMGLTPEGLEDQAPEFPHHSVGSSYESSYEPGY